MSLASSTLAAIQQAGAAVYAADADLKQVVQTYAARVTAAMAANPFGLGNDALFENWKTLARLSQSMTAIEAELKKVYFVAEDVVDPDGPAVTALPALAAPTASTATDVVVKSATRAGTRGRRAERRSVAAPEPERSSLPGNAAKLLKYLETVLTTDHFQPIKPTVSARHVEMPLGSVSAAIKKLVTSGHLVAGPAGGFKLKRTDAVEVMV
ncbi:MAG: hypothetical protein WAV85_12665 [Rhodoferax sp.]